MDTHSDSFLCFFSFSWSSLLFLNLFFGNWIRNTHTHTKDGIKLSNPRQSFSTFITAVIVQVINTRNDTTTSTTTTTATAATTTTTTVPVITTTSSGVTVYLGNLQNNEMQVRRWTSVSACSCLREISWRQWMSTRSAQVSILCLGMSECQTGS